MTSIHADRVAPTRTAVRGADKLFDDERVLVGEVGIENRLLNGSLLVNVQATIMSTRDCNATN